MRTSVSKNPLKYNTPDQKKKKKNELESEIKSFLPCSTYKHSPLQLCGRAQFCMKPMSSSDFDLTFDFGTAL